jgi:hypothetical protein
MPNIVKKSGKPNLLSPLLCERNLLSEHIDRYTTQM